MDTDSMREMSKIRTDFLFCFVDFAKGRAIMKKTYLFRDRRRSDEYLYRVG